jgi:hypothetical protein
MTDAEFSSWLGRFGVTLDQNNNPKFSGRVSEFVLLAYLPKEADGLYDFASWLAQWLPIDHDRVIWLKHWMSVASQDAIFEQLRCAHGSVSLPIGSAPGQLFASNRSLTADKRASTQLREQAILSSMILFIALFDWKAYMLADRCMEYVYLADECVAFSSPHRGALEALTQDLESFGCKVSWIKAV